MTLNEVNLKMASISSHQGIVTRAIADYILSGEAVLSYSNVKAKRKVVFVLAALELDYKDDGKRLRLTDEAIDKIAPAVKQYRKSDKWKKY